MDLCRESVAFYDCTATCVLVAQHVGKHHFKFDGDQALREAREELLRCQAALGRETELRVELQRLQNTAGRRLVTVYARAQEYVAAVDEHHHVLMAASALNALRVALGQHLVNGQWVRNDLGAALEGYSAATLSDRAAAEYAGRIMGEVTTRKDFPSLHQQMMHALEGQAYLRRLLRDVCPKMEQEEDWRFFCTQIDNYIAGLRQENTSLGEETAALRSMREMVAHRLDDIEREATALRAYVQPREHNSLGAMFANLDAAITRAFARVRQDEKASDA
jgi:hypothetical protein